MTESKLVDLIKVTQLTQFMLTKADAESWDDITKLEKHRATLLKDIFPLNETQQQPDFTKQLEKLIALNSQLTLQCKDKKQSLQREVQGVSKNKKAIRAYQAR
jgi:hypothetical protein